MTWDVRNENVKLASGNNIRLTQGLFIEFHNSDEGAPYTLKDNDVVKGDRTYVSLPRVYLESADEYEAAMRLLGSWSHWQKMLKLKWFVNGIEQFNFEGLEALRETMAARDRSLARKKLIEAAEQGNVTAAKILLDANAVPKKKVGRPEKGKTEESGDDNLIQLFNKVST